MLLEVRTKRVRMVVIFLGVEAVSEREREGALEMLAILFLECDQFLKVPSAVQLWVLFSMYIILS